MLQDIFIFGDLPIEANMKGAMFFAILRLAG